MKYIVLLFVVIALCLITSSFISQTSPTFGLKIVKLVGTKWNLSEDCSIDDIPVTCQIANKSYADYKSKIQECTPCWLEITDYNGNKISAGLAINIASFTHHHYYFGKFIKYKNGTDSTSTFIDSSYNIDSLLMKSPEKIRAFLKDNSKYYY